MCYYITIILSILLFVVVSLLTPEEVKRKNKITKKQRTGFYLLFILFIFVPILNVAIALSVVLKTIGDIVEEQ